VAIDDAGLRRLHELAPARAQAQLLACCASQQWARAVVAARPYPDRRALLAFAGQVLDGLGWDEVRHALDAHPRIGERATGTRPEAAWSRREQAGMDGATTQVRAALAEANRAYEQRFGHVFLIFASGRTDAQMLAAASQRLGNDEATERGVVRGELSRIVALRLERLLDEGLLEEGPLDEGLRDL
jgi:2-oxo-4-hydroxy-4-carboxy-5-ureidoimidazoline decarboxylase